MSCTTYFFNGEMPISGMAGSPYERRRGRPPTGQRRHQESRSSRRQSTVFAAKGYAGASLRAVGREAEVDPALVHHYFDGKAALFVAAMALPFNHARSRCTSVPVLDLEPQGRR